MGKRRAKRGSTTGNHHPFGKTPVAEGGSAACAEGAGSRLRPWLLGAAIALFVARPLLPSESVATTGDGLPLVMLAIILAALWALGATRRPVRVRFGATDVAVLVLVLLNVVAAVHGATHGSPRPAVNMLWQWIGLGLGYFLVRVLISTRREARAVAAVMIGLAVALSTYGLYQYFYELPQTRAEAKDPVRLSEMLQEAGLWYPPGSPERRQFENRLFSTEPIATFALTNSLAGLLAPWLVVAVGIGAAAGIGRRAQRTWTAVLGAGLPIAACLVLTKSRTAYGATALGLVLVGLFCRPTGRSLGWKLPLAAAAAVAILLAAALAVGGLDIEVLSEAQKSLGYRAEYWQATLAMIGDRPVLGCGPGNFQDTYTIYKLPGTSEEVAEPHNFLMEVWATAGTPAMLAMLVVLGGFGWRLWRGRRGAADEAGNGLHTPPEQPPDHSDAVRFVFGGAVIGFLLAWPLGLLSTTVPSPVVLLLGLPLGAIVVVLLVGWVDEGHFPFTLPAIGVIVLLVNLLGAGGISFPGVAGTLWLLLALGLHAAETRRPVIMHRTAAAAALVVFTALAVICYRTAYDPVLRAGAAIRLAQREPFRAERHLLAAAEADPLSAEPWHQLASLVFAQWQQDRSPTALRRFDQYNHTALENDPNSSPARLVTGDRHLEAYWETNRKGHLDRALEAYRRAVELYPNSGVYRAKLALAHRAAGDRKAFEEQAKAALELDKLTPHADKKIPGKLRHRLMRSMSKP